ncbi:MAG: PIN domain-containing protein [Planctomycetota bacterium]
MQKVVDASALLAYLNKESGWQKMEELLATASDKDRPLLMTAVNWGEVYYIILRHLDDYNLAEDVERSIQTLPIEVIGVDREMAKEAAHLKVNYKLASADAFAAALAKSHRAELITCDKEFKAVEDSVKINWI